MPFKYNKSTSAPPYFSYKVCAPLFSFYCAIEDNLAREMGRNYVYKCNISKN